MVFVGSVSLADASPVWMVPTPDWPAERDCVCDETAMAETGQIGPGDPQVIEQGDRIGSASIVIERSMSAVCPWLSISATITCLFAARSSSNDPKLRSMVNGSPWRRPIGVKAEATVPTLPLVSTAKIMRCSANEARPG